MEKHRNADGTYDVDAFVASMDIELEKFRQFFANREKLAACPYHEFEQIPLEPLPPGWKSTEHPRYRCKNCGGVVNEDHHYFHEQGRRTRHDLQAEGKHPAPCARFCEDNAFQIEIRRLTGMYEQARTERDALARELLTPDVFQRLVNWLREDPIRPSATAFTADIERQIAYALEMDVLPEVKRLRMRLQALGDRP